ncbi:MAG: hypothetical protein KF729_08310 [Sandaracinaceae bacterium]|nr:hypothetical protein [Sandaracinaceae bacterium]
MRVAAILAVVALTGCTSPACPAQDARGDGVCNLVLGYRWDGERCEVVSGCACAGADWRSPRARRRRRGL